MRTSIENLLDDAQKKMSGYAALFNYRMMNLSVKANPEALLPVEVQLGGEILNIEKVAKARNAPDRDDQFEIFPLEGDWLFPIVRGLASVHPEYKVELKLLEEGEEDVEDNKYILATMPPVDDDRYDVLTKGVSALSDACDAKIKETFDKYLILITMRLAGAQDDELDEAKDALQQLYDSHADLCKQFRENKDKEIEEAHEAWLAGQAEREAKRQEEDAVRDSQLVGLKMRMNQDEDD